MARGRVSIEFPLPVMGWRADASNGHLPPQALRHDFDQPIAERSVNVLISRSGTLRPREGYVALRDFASAHLGSFWVFEDPNDYLLVATKNSWHRVNANGLPIENIQEPNPFWVPQSFFPVRMDTLGFYAGSRAVVAASGKLNSPLLVYSRTGGFKPASSFAADDVTVIVDRSVAAGIRDGGQIFDRRIRWSSVLDPFSWNELAFIDFEGETGPVVAVRASTHTSGIIYCERGAYRLQAVSGDDVRAFVTDRIETLTTGPVSPSAIASVGGEQFFIGRDRRIWQTNGTQAQPISTSIEPVWRELVDWNGPPSAFIVFHDEWLDRIYVVAPAEARLLIGRHASIAVIIDRAIGYISPPLLFRSSIRSLGIAYTDQRPRWDGMEDPWISSTQLWEELSGARYRRVIVGFSDGVLGAYGEANNDAGLPIQYVATWASQKPPDFRQRFVVNTIEAFFRSDPASMSEVSVNLKALRSPLAPSEYLQLFYGTMHPHDPSGWVKNLEPTIPIDPMGSAQQPGNWLTLTVSGLSDDGNPALTRFVASSDLEERPDYLPEVINIM